MKKRGILIALFLFCAVTSVKASMVVEALEAAKQNVHDTAFRHWSGVAVFDMKYDQWLAGAMTSLSVVKDYALHFDVGYAHPLYNAKSARGAGLAGASIHLDETEWYSKLTEKALSFVPLIDPKAMGLFNYTTVGGSFGYSADRSIDNNGRYTFIDGIFYGWYAGLEKTFDGPVVKEVKVSKAYDFKTLAYFTGTSLDWKRF